MKQYVKFSFLVLSLLVFMQACTHKMLQVSYTSTNGYRLNKDYRQDSSLVNYILPYKQKLDAQMNRIIIESDCTLTKDQPNCHLGNLVADAMLYHAQKTNPKVDFAVLNNGGVRLPSLSKGPISVGKIYELMPFENSLVILTIPGDSLLQLFKIMGFKGGWPCAGIQYTMDHKNVSKVLFDNNRTLDSKQNYTIAINDYLANGGDNCTMLKNAAQTATGLTIRDAVLTYLEFLHNKGQKITLPTKIRIQNVE